MNYEAYDQSPGAEDDYSEETPLDERVRKSFVPLLAIFGSEDRIYDANESLSAYAELPGTRTELIEEAEHSPTWRPRGDGEAHPRLCPGGRSITIGEGGPKPSFR
jgi:pimeloyl-ACP methyl ester carboxylesterase